MREIIENIQELRVQQSMADEGFDFGTGEIKPDMPAKPFEEGITVLVKELFSQPNIEIVTTQETSERENGHSRKQKGKAKLKRLKEKKAPVWEKEGSGGVFIQKHAKPKWKKASHRKAIKSLRQTPIEIEEY